MQIGAIGRGQVVQRAGPRARITETDTTRYVARARRQQATTVLSRLQRSLARIDETARSHTTRRDIISDPTARSAEPLGLTATSTPTTLRSTAEINTVTTSYSETNPAWTRGSTRAVTLGGVYDGSQGTDTLRFRIVDRGNGYRLRVFDSGGTRHDNILMRFTDPPGTVYTLSNGMTFSMGPGSIVNRDQFWIDVDDDDPQAPDPSAPFDGSSGVVNFEPSTTVTAGSFEVNGTTIGVDADDSISSVLAEITALADVDAIYDAGTEQVVLTHRTNGSAPTITVGNDTSGFLAAVKLDSAVADPGTDGRGEAEPLRSTVRFAGVVAGTITVNGTAIAVDPVIDTLEDVLDRIEGNVAGVSAGYLLSRDVVLVRGSGRRLEIADDTGLLDALAIEHGTYRAKLRESKEMSRADRSVIGAEMSQVVRDLNQLGELNRLESSLLGGFMVTTADLFQGRDDRNELGMLGLGITSRSSRIDFGQAGARRLDRGLVRDSEQVVGLLYGPDAGDAGLLGELEVMVTAALSINELGL